MLRNHDLRRQVVNYVCPDGQNYYRCYTGSYAGCCSHDPCASGHCGTNPSSDAGQCLADPNDTTVTVTVTQGNFEGEDSPPATSAFLTTAGSDPTDVSRQSPTSMQGSTTDSSISLTRQPQSAGQEPSTSTLPTGNTSLTPSPSITSSSSHTHTHSQATQSTISTTPTPTTIPHSHHEAKIITGVTIGAVAGLALISLLLYLCCSYLRRRHRSQKSGSRKKLNININRKQNDKDLEKRKKALTEAETILAQREKALRDLENRDPVSPT